MLRCPSCMVQAFSSYVEIAEHMHEKASESDAGHVMWLNRFISKDKGEIERIAGLLQDLFRTDSLKRWIIDWMVKRFYGEYPHPFVLDMQHPSRETLLGYAYEHHHFLKQWVKSCALIISKTEAEDIQRFEIDNILSEWHGFGSRMPSHHELLLRMGESYGADRGAIYTTVPINATSDAISFWDLVCREFSALEGIAAMHSLELIANRNLRKYGATCAYFDPAILTDGSVTRETVEFLREGYEADVAHSELALDLLEKHVKGEDDIYNCQAVFLASMEHFYDYLSARKERGDMFANKQ